MGFPLYYTRLGTFAPERDFLDGIDSGNNGYIRVRVQPGASRNRVSGSRDGAVRVSVTAPPQGGRANAAVLELLADALGVAGSRLSIVRGIKSRDKVVAVEGLASEDVHRLLEPTAQSPAA